MLPKYRKINWQDAISDFAADRVDLSPLSLKDYTDTLNRLARFVGSDITSVGRMHILRFLQQFKHAQTYNVFSTRMNVFFKWASDFYGIPNFVGKLKYKKIIDPTSPRILTDDEYARIVAAKGKNRDRCVFLANTGLRAAEFVNMQIVGNAVSVLGKGGKRRVVPLNKTALEILPRLKFSKNSRSLYKAVHRFGISIGIPDLHPHILRHYFATRLVKQSANIADVAKLLGHSDVKVTVQYYYHPDDLSGVVTLLDSV